MQKRISISTLLLVAGLTVGCGGGSEPVTFEQLPQRIGDSVCARIFRCCDAAELMAELEFFDPAPTTEAECAQAYAGLFPLSFGELQTAIDEGRISYDGDAAGACFDAADAAACGDEVSFGEAAGCEEFLVGLVPDGGMCKQDAECAVESSYCDTDGSEVFGTCVPLPGIGDPCVYACVEDAYCDDMSMCAERKADAAACIFDSECLSGNCDDTDMVCTAEGPATCDGM